MDRAKRTRREFLKEAGLCASVLAIARGEGGVIDPRSDEVLRAGDILALAGTKDCIAAAREVLERRRDGA